MYDDGNRLVSSIFGISNVTDCDEWDSEDNSDFPTKENDAQDGQIPWTEGRVVKGDPYYGNGSTYLTIEGSGIFLLSVQNATVDWVGVAGNTGTKSIVLYYDLKGMELPYQY